MKVKFAIESLNECEYLRWVKVHSLGGKKFGFCNAGEKKPLLKDSVPSPPHGELCPVLASDECRFYKEKEE